MEGSPQPERDALRSAVHDELIDLLVEGGCMRNAMRSEVEAALWRWSQASKSSVPEHSKRVATSDCAGQALASRAGPRAPSNPKGTPPEAPSAPGSGVDIGAQPHKEWGSLGVASVGSGRNSDNESSASMDAAAVAHFSKFVKSVTSTIPECFGPEVGDMIFGHRLRQKAADFWDWLQNIEPPAPVGRVARFTTGKVFDGAITVTIIINSVWMMYVADAKIKDPYRDDSWAFAGDCVFQAIYTIEMAMKLWVFRHWFFCSPSWRINVFELALVCLGFLSLVTARSSVSFLRVLRILEIGRASRVLRAMTHFKHLRALMVCIQGSISSLLWSLFMVVLVYSIFALFLVQIIAGHLIETGKVVEETFFFDSFGSIARAMLTLHMACTGGLGWEVAYEQIETTGVMGSVIYLIFIIFVNFALMNIITGIFVESAMAVLKPDPEVFARELSQQEWVDAQKLDRLCRAVDTDESGKLTREQFENGLQKNHIPLLLKSLGLQRHHLVEFFKLMAEDSGGDGQVDIHTFVNGCMVLRGVATNFDLQKLHAELKSNHAQHDKHLNSIMRILREKFDL